MSSVNETPGKPAYRDLFEVLCAKTGAPYISDMRLAYRRAAIWAAAKEQAVAVPAQLVEQVVGAGAVGVADIDDPDVPKRLQNRLLAERRMRGRLPQRPAAPAGDGVLQLGRVAQKDQPAAGLTEGLQARKRGGAQRLAGGRHNGVVGHFAHFERSVPPEDTGTAAAIR